MKHLTDCVKTVRVSNAVAAGSTDSNGSSVDMQGYDAVRFIALLGTLTTNQVTALKAQQSSDNGSSDAFADIADSATSPMGDDDDNDMLITDIIRPTERYVRPVVERATANAVIDGVIAELYMARDEPATQDATVIDTVKLVSPAEGTA